MTPSHTNQMTKLKNILSNHTTKKMYFEVRNLIKTLHNQTATVNFLIKCLSNNNQIIIPPTFQINNKPNLNIANALKLKWQIQSKNTSKSFMQIAIDNLQSQIRDSKQQTKETQLSLYQNLSNEDKQIAVSTLLNYELILSRNLKDAKIKKYNFLHNKQVNVLNTPRPAHPKPPFQETPHSLPSINSTPALPLRENPSPPPSPLTQNSSMPTQNKSNKKKNRPGIRERQFIKKQKKAQKQAQISAIFNFSDFQLDNATEKLLNRGLNFAIKTPIPNTTQMQADCKKLERQMAWKEHFKDNTTTYVSQIFKQEKTNLPPKPIPPNLTSFLNTIQSHICDKTKWNREHFNPNQTNISKEEQKALEILKQKQQDKQLIIKPADKGAGICIIDYQKYIDSCMTHLNSVQLQEFGPTLRYYTLSSEKQAFMSKSKILHILKQGKEKGWLTNLEFNLMNPKDSNLAKFYQIFKVHKPYKDGNLPPARPIINNIGSLTENISKYVDYHTKDLAKSLPSYLEDTRDFLSLCEKINSSGNLKDDHILVTIDVISLYTNISKQDAIPAVKYYLETRPDKTIPSSFIIELLELVFDCNYFKFGNRVFKQEIGVAMGTISAPNTATLTMGKLIDPKFHQLALDILNSSDPIMALKRFLDDYFMVWTGGLKSLEKFLVEINNIHPNLKFTYNYSSPFQCYEDPKMQHDCFCHTTRKISFLDVEVKIQNGKLITDIYRKPTDRCQYLLPSSCHPPHVIKNIPYSLFHRIVRICSERETLITRMDELKGFFLLRNYDPKLINSCMTRALQLNRSDTLEKVNKEQNSRAIFTTTYHPALPHISKILKDSWRMNIETDNQLNKVFNKPPMIAYKQPPQSKLRQILVKSTLPDREQRVLPGLKPCNEHTCNICPYIDPKSTTQSSNNSSIAISISCEATCSTRNVVYCITCSHCKVQYIGETGRTLRARIGEHIGYIRSNKNTTTGQHFQQHNHHMKVTILHVLKNESETTRKIKELRCINSFETISKGLNNKY